jgi:hypothetical protein
MKKIFYKMPRGARFIFMLAMAAAFLSLVSFIVMTLWNNLLPEILHVQAINFWQAAGIFILCKLLFGFGRMGGFRRNRMHFKHRLEDRIQTMTPEERERFKEKFASRNFWCGEKMNKPDEANT